MAILSSAISGLALKIRAVEDGWFDWTRKIDTKGDPSARPAGDVVGGSGDGLGYLPARAKNVRQALEKLPTTDFESYTFIDMGSGKGRVVFLAAELPFRRVIGVEHSAALHNAALGNLQQWRGGGADRARIELVHADAGGYELPAGNMVLHFFNPFGAVVMERVLANVQDAMERERREVLIVMLWPELAGMVAKLPQARQCYRSRRFEIFALGQGAAGGA
jgi:SAM-dependent methyltransferase